VEVVCGSPPEESDLLSLSNELDDSSTGKNLHNLNSFIGNSLDMEENQHGISSLNSTDCEFSWERGVSADGGITKDEGGGDDDDAHASNMDGSLVVAHRDHADLRSSFLPPGEGVWGYTLYLQMELCTGGCTLADSLRSKERKDVNEAATSHILAQILCALDWIHRQVHAPVCQ
jgi:serine/threonine protein kinase